MARQRVTDLAASVDESREARQALIARFGIVPVSVLKLSRGALSRSLFNLPNEKRRGSKGANAGMSRVDPADNHKGERGRSTSRARRELGIVGGVPAAAQGAVSVMPGELVDFTIKYYAKSGQTYLDPFAGQGVQLQVAALHGMKYFGYDACTEYVDYITTIVDRLGLSPDVAHVTRGDSRFPTEIPDGIGDFCFTSPPYYDVEYYGPEAEQLGNEQTYDDFMKSMLDIYRAWLPKFKPGAWMVVNTNDIRRDKEFLPYHSDTTSALREAGWLLHDTWIVEGLISGLPKIFAVQHNSRRTAPKIHEYLIVARCPG